ncbi:MAG: outer membrane beta-barrel protein, partial [Gemmatimonadota bacterium]
MTSPVAKTLLTPLIAVLSLMLVAPELSSQVNVGAFGGFDMTDLSGDAPAKTKYLAETGFTAGVVGELSIATDVWLSLQPSWLQRGTRIAFAVEGEEEAVDSLKLAADYFAVPLLVKIVAGHGKTYVSGGVDLG